MNVETLLRILSVALIGGLFGAFATQWVITGQGGRTILGGFAFGYLFVALYKKWKAIEMPTGDLFAVAMSAGEAIGRWGCYFGGCCYGRACSLPWAVFQHSEMRHPTQIYMSISSIVLLIILLMCEMKRPPVNFIFYLQGTLYCVFRFTIEFFRDVDRLACGLTAAQVGCLFGALFFGVMLWRLMCKTYGAPFVLGAGLERRNG